MVVPTLLEFADKMNEILPVIMKEFTRHQANELSKGAITLPQLLMLDFIHERGECKMKDLAIFMKVTTAGVTGVVDRLVRDGYVERRVDEHDRRIIKVSLTKKGNAVFKKISEQRRKMVIAIFGRISEQDRHDYLRILMQIRNILLQNGLSN
ncbi:MAG: MarR family transcriptional regulator [Candidatus Omnitrophica bacterium]|nr:MarR family transcriptional regulator [Candidatus Omnitrophota bacterium]